MEKYYKAAKKRVKKKKEFYNHLTYWGVICTFLFILNMFTSPSTWWWIFPTLGWGLGVAIHGITTFGSLKDSDWEQREINKEMGRLYKNDSTRDDYGELDLDEIPNSKQYAADKFDDLRKEWDERDFV